MIKIRLLGKPHVQVDGRTIEKFPTAKALALLAYLALERDGAHAREDLLLLFWPEHDDKSARQNLSQTLSRLRRVLKPAARHLTANRLAIAFAPDAPLQVDVVEFVRLIESAEQHPHADRASCPTCQAQLATAVELARGEFLSGVQIGESAAFDQWLFFNRERLRELLLEALSDLSDGGLGGADYRKAVDYARRQIALEAWRERAFQQLIRALALSGEQSAALHEYERLRQVLSAEFNVEPTAETRKLIEQVRAGRVQAAATQTTTPGHNLPTALTPIIGRETIIEEIIAAIETNPTRMTTLTGPGGVGKTRLALEIGRRLIDRPTQPFTGVWFVPLASVAHAENIPLAVATALGLQLASSEPTSQAVINQLRSRQLLLILDNMEQLLDGRSWLINLLQAAPDVHLLLTSRERMRLRSEDVYVLNGLAIPGEAVPLTQARDYAAAVLFLDSVRRVDKRWQLNHSSWEQVRAICRLLDGLPLGIELAAALIDSANVAQIAAQIQMRWSDVLTTDYDDIAPHQRSMQAVLAQSWERLSQAEQTALARLSVMRGTFTRDDAGQVAAAPRLIIKQLIYKSLLQITSGDQLQIHPLVRLFAAHKLDEQSTLAYAAKHTHAELFVTRASHYYHAKSEQQEKLRVTLLRSLDNLYAGWEWAITTDQTRLLVTSINGMARFGNDIVRFTEGENPFQSLIDRYAARPRAELSAEARLLLARAYVQAAGMWLDRAYESIGKAELEKAEPLVASVNEPTLSGLFAYHKGRLLLAQAKSDEALAILENGLEQIRRSDDWLVKGSLLREIGSVYRQRGDYNTFLYYIKESLELARAVDDRVRQQALLYFLGMYTIAAGGYWQGRAYLLEAQTFDAVTQSVYHRAAIGSTLGQVATLLGDYEAGLQLHLEAQRVLKPINEPWRMTGLLVDLSITQTALGALEDASASLAEASRLAQERELVERQATVTLAQAHLLLAAERWQAACDKANEAAVQMAAFRRQIGVVEATVIHAFGALRGNLTYDPIALDAALTFIANEPLDGAQQRELLYWLAYRVTKMTKRPLAKRLLTSGSAFVQHVVKKIDDPAYLNSYLTNTPVKWISAADDNDRTIIG